MNWKAATVYFGLGVIFGVVGAFWVLDTDETRNLSIQFPTGGSIELSAEADGSIDHAAVLERIYSREFSRSGMLSWLQSKQVYSLDDWNLPDALAELCGASREEREACVEITVIEDLRVKMLSHSPPFHYVGEDVEIGVPNQEDQPPMGRAHACAGGPWSGRRIELSSPATGNSVEVVADAGVYTCTGEVRTPELQLNFEDADRLFGGEPLREYGSARAVVLR